MTFTPDEEHDIRAATKAVMQGVRFALNVVPSRIAGNVLSSIALSCATSLAAWVVANNPARIEANRQKLLDAFELGVAGKGIPLEGEGADLAPRQGLH